MVDKITDKEFLQVIENQPMVMVKYFANWCGNCRLFSPKFTKLSKKEDYQNVHFVEVNAEENPEARKFAGVNHLPFFAAIKNGVLVKTDTTTKEENVENMIKILLS